MKKTSEFLKRKKQRREKITMVTCYDHPTAMLEDRAGIDVILVGDSVGTNVLGYESERQVTMEDMIHHLEAVRRGVSDAYLLVDLPYRSCETPADALDNARRLLSHGADGVKPEGLREDVVRALMEDGIEVCGHLGLNPQLHDKKAFHAKTGASAITLFKDALALETAGASLLVLEMIPEEVGRMVTTALKIPTIGIGAGRHTDGQVLVVNDLLGINTFALRHVSKYEDLNARSTDALRRYIEDVAGGRFPGEANVRHLEPAELRVLETWAQEELGIR